ncbi:MAG: Si-specific NAD(P)(+) transhydrogenase [Planctomycetaceae bacterium]|nr:Si-specific NAD(P)(+) transhydrogenase [Planctomycetales bacterium]MCB9922849.1 Si-specific NAD(P)(+) transhydrogenase [Planctomycetaceae bacterium]
MSATQYEFDVLVIGTGPAGEGAAMQAVKQGKRVVAIEQLEQVGGSCTHRGTIPSKALRNAIFKVTEAWRDPLLAGVTKRPGFPELRKSASAVISQQVAMRRGFYDRNSVEVLRGAARFSDPHTIAVGDRSVTAENIVIAVGSRPYHPEDVDFSHPRVFDSDTILDLSFNPKSITIYGAGVIGSEYASIFRNLGAKVNLVNTRAKLLEFLDDEIIDALSYHLRDQGVLIRHGEDCEHIEGCDDGVVLHLTSGKKLKTEALLWANGRQGNTDIDLSNAGLEADSRGQLVVNDVFQTSVPHIYAVGDVIGFPSLASAAYTQGRAAASHIVGETDLGIRAELVPTGIYTSPEISSIGKTERELTSGNIPYEVGHAHFKSIARAQITGQTVGMLKILFHRETLELLGVHCFGANASEIIHIGQAIMSQQGDANSLLYFINTTFNYPTMAEAYRVAALNGYNRLF